MKIGILGASGMLGSQLAEYFATTDYDVSLFTRTDIDAETSSISDIQKRAGGLDYLINAIGIIKPYIHDDNSFEVQRAMIVNGLFPHKLAEAIKGTNTKIIQIATDCVYDGVIGNYTENHLHNATDVYGKTKSLGEVIAPNFINLRCSIIGPEKKGKLSLLEWFLNQPKDTVLKGYTNHFWNGLTTLAFSKICHGIIKMNTVFLGVQHVVPANRVSKLEILEIFAETFHRTDITMQKFATDASIDRTLRTNNPSFNEKLWLDAGYSQISSIKEMIQEIG